MPVVKSQAQIKDELQILKHYAKAIPRHARKINAAIQAIEQEWTEYQIEQEYDERCENANGGNEDAIRQEQDAAQDASNWLYGSSATSPSEDFKPLLKNK